MNEENNNFCTYKLRKKHYSSLHMFYQNKSTMSAGLTWNNNELNTVPSQGSKSTMSAVLTWNNNKLNTVPSQGSNSHKKHLS